MPDEHVITVAILRKEYDSLKRQAAMYRALADYGVDNWDGYSDALRPFFQDDDED